VQKAQSPSKTSVPEVTASMVPVVLVPHRARDDDCAVAFLVLADRLGISA